MNTKNDTKIDLVIKNGSVIFPNYKTEKADIGISEGKICEIGSVDRSQANQVVDAKGLIVMPGAIDTQVHFREPGLTHKEDIHKVNLIALCIYFMYTLCILYACN